MLKLLGKELVIRFFLQGVKRGWLLTWRKLIWWSLFSPKYLFRVHRHDTEDSIATSSVRHKIVVMGAAKVGKSSLINQFLYNKYTPKYKRTVEEMHQGNFSVAGVGLTLDILDTSGANEVKRQNRYREGLLTNQIFRTKISNWVGLHRLNRTFTIGLKRFGFLRIFK